MRGASGKNSEPLKLVQLVYFLSTKVEIFLFQFTVENG